MTRLLFGFYLLLVSALSHGSAAIEVPEHRLLQNTVQIEVQVCQPWQVAVEHPKSCDNHQTQLIAQQQSLADYPFNQQFIDELFSFQQKVLVKLYQQQTQALFIPKHNNFCRYQLQLFATEDALISPA